MANQEPSSAGRSRSWPGLRDKLRILREVPAAVGANWQVLNLIAAAFMTMQVFALELKETITNLVPSGEAERAERRRETELSDWNQSATKDPEWLTNIINSNEVAATVA